MAGKEFDSLELNGHNYPTWSMDIKIALASREIVRAIQNPDDPLPAGAAPLREEQKYVALYIIRHHIHPDLKSEYLEEESLFTLFQALKTRYEKQKAVVLPEALHDWTHLRFQDFKSVGDYNHEAEKHDELLAKNGSQRPVGSQPLPEVHMNVANGRKFGGAFNGNQSNFKGKCKRNRNRKPRNSDRRKGTAKPKYDKTRLCDKCGCYTHPTNKCKTPKHLAILYQQSQGRKAPQGKRFEANFNLHPDGTNGAGCSQDAPPGPSNTMTLQQPEDPMSTENMMIEYASNNVFGDFD
uniref:Uncharacterized protein n=1 Tax=Avena sativa TaxID=4498 RepID=A0ACD5THZ7_AVESA